jgi:hypothetical protein
MGRRKPKIKKPKRRKRKTFVKRRTVPSQQEIESKSKFSTQLDGVSNFFGFIANLNTKNTITNVGSLIIDKVSYGGKQKHIVRNGKKIELNDIPFNFAYVSDEVKNCAEPTLLKTPNEGLLITFPYYGVKEIKVFDIDKLKFKNGEHVAISFELLYSKKEELMKFIKNTPKVRFFCYQD